MNTISFVSVTSSDSGCADVPDGQPRAVQHGDVSIEHLDVPGSHLGYTLNGTGTLKWADEAYDAERLPPVSPLTLTVSSS